MPHLSKLSTFGTYPSTKPFSTRLSLRLTPLAHWLSPLHMAWTILSQQHLYCKSSILCPSFFFYLYFLSLEMGFGLIVRIRFFCPFFFFFSFFMYWDFGNFCFFETGFYWELGKKKRKAFIFLGFEWFFWFMGEKVKKYIVYTLESSDDCYCCKKKLKDLTFVLVNQ